MYIQRNPPQSQGIPRPHKRGQSMQQTAGLRSPYLFGWPSEYQQRISGFVSKHTANIKTLAWYYCGDYLNAAGSFLYAASSAPSSEANRSSTLTIDCGGTRGGPEDTGLCDRLYDGPAKGTSFQHLMKPSHIPVKDLSSYFHPYVALGSFQPSQPSGGDSVEFDPQRHVVEPLSLVAVLCNGKMFYGLWADTNNDTVPRPLVGQLSVAMAKMCYGEQAVETQQRLDTSDLMFLAFTGTEAAPGYYGADWDAETPMEFEQGLALLGNKLIKRRVLPGKAAPQRDLPGTLIWLVLMAASLVVYL
ncbi:chitosanase [Apiospora marii]|uniref:chitosanase n=1 Tax=Apiospora marii TaxID=335849 RepID=UPI00312D7029